MHWMKINIGDTITIRNILHLHLQLTLITRFSQNYRNYFNLIVKFFVGRYSKNDEWSTPRVKLWRIVYQNSWINKKTHDSTDRMIAWWRNTHRLRVQWISLRIIFSIRSTFTAFSALNLCTRLLRATDLMEVKFHDNILSWLAIWSSILPYKTSVDIIIGLKIIKLSPW